MIFSRAITRRFPAWGEAACGLFLAAQGFGDKWAYTTALALWLFGASALRAATQTQWLQAAAMWALFAAAAWAPALLLALPAAALAAFCTGRAAMGTALLLCGLPRNAAAFLPLPLFAFHPAVAALLFAAVYAAARCFPRANRLWQAAGAAALALAAAAVCQSHALPAVAGQKVAAGYAVGEALEHLSGDTSRLGLLSYNHAEEGADDTEATALYLDHDSDHPLADSAADWQQGDPWSRRMPLAPDWLAWAVNTDGYYAANLGERLKERGLSPLLCLFDGGELCPLISQQQRGERSRLVLADSDIVVNGMVPYQETILRALAGTERRQIFPFCALLLTAAAAMFLCPQHPRLRLLPLLAAAAAVCLSEACPHRGDIRYVGKAHHWPHTDLGEGVARRLQDLGQLAFFGNSGCRVLVVGSGYKAQVKGEKLIILEPGATAELGENRLSADTTPLGEQSGIPDARHLLLNGRPLGEATQTINGIRVLASGSPAKIKDEILLLP